MGQISADNYIHGAIEKSYLLPFVATLGMHFELLLLVNRFTVCSNNVETVHLTSSVACAVGN